MTRFDGKIALVTGGGRGVGKAVATSLASHGAHVIINCFHSYDVAKRLCQDLIQAGGSAEVIRASVAQPAQLDSMFASVQASHGGIDFLVNNAALGGFNPALAVEESQLDRAIDVGLKGSLWCAQRAHPLLVARGGGAIVNVSSVGAGMVVGNYLPVGTTKAAIESLTRYLATDFAGDNIRVNTASAGLLQSDVAELFPDSDDLKEVVIGNTPLGRLGTSQELAEVVLFLLSDAARWVTGQCIVADGGLQCGAAMLTPAGQWGRMHKRASGRLTDNTIAAADSTATVEAAAPSPAAAQVQSALPAARAAAQPRTRTWRGARDSASCGPDSRRVVAVVGAGLVTPGASGPQQFWDVLDAGPQLFSETRAERFPVAAFRAEDPAAEDKTYQTSSGYAHDYQPHDWLADELGADRRGTEYTTQFFRHAVYDAVRNVVPAAGERTSCVMGYTPDGNQHLEETVVVEGFLDLLERIAHESGRGPAQRSQLVEAARAALRTRYEHNIASPRLLPYQVAHAATEGLLSPGREIMTVDTACSSALYALDIGMKAILEGKHDIAVCGGSFAVGPRNAVLFAKLHGLSKSGRMRPLDAASDGVLFSDGAAAVTLKRLDLAQRDGDEILGYIAAVGTSSDGRGKAIYAPNVVGQKLAIERARAKRQDGPAPEWVVAHATGTPAGDLCEVTSIADVLRPTSSMLLTSNKALVGHTGWAAGVVSLIQVLLGFEKDAIQGQHNYSGSGADFGLRADALHVPTTTVAWPPHEDKPRVAAVSGFGFGGTNAHVVVQDSQAVHAEPSTEDVVLCAWSAHFPGVSSSAEVKDWLTGQGPAPEGSFGDNYDAAELPMRLPPRVLRTIDRCQLMAVRAAAQLQHDLGEVWDQYRESTGVFLGHMGPTRNAVLYSRRCHLDNVLQVLDELPQATGWQGQVRDGVVSAVQAAVPASTEDSFPGIMPNVISARVSNHFDLRGPNLVVDMGLASTLGALEVAARYLRSGDIDVAVVGGVSGNSTPVARHLLDRLSNGPGLQPAEGAVLFAAVRRSLADKHGLPVLATLGPLVTAAASADGAAPAGSDEVSSGQRATTYLGAEAAVRLLRLLVQPSTSEAVVTVADGLDCPTSSMSIRRTAEPDSTEPESTEPDNAELSSAERLVTRCSARWVATGGHGVSPAITGLPPGSVVLTATPELLGELGSHAGDPLVLSTRPVSGVRRRYLAELTEESLRAALGTELGSASQLRVFTDLAALSDPGTALDEDPDDLFRLQDAMFLLLRVCDRRLREDAGSVLCLFTSASTKTVLHPAAGLFTAFIQSAAMELPGSAVRAVFTSESRLAPALKELELETTAEPLTPIALYEAGRRHTWVLDDQPAADPRAVDLHRESVVVAVGGARGITAEALKALVRQVPCRIYTIGSLDVAGRRADVERHGGPAAMQRQEDFVREQRAADPQRPLRSIVEEYRELSNVAEVLRSLAELQEHSGPGRATYLQADVIDEPALRRAFDQIFDAEPAIDLLIHAAGINRAGSITSKSLDNFRRVRAIKVGGYLNLRRVLAGRSPRRWCNFGSLTGFTGQVGETDYSAANAFLSTAATWLRQLHDTDEFTIGWTMWKDAGMASSPVHRSYFTSGALGDVLSQMSSAEGRQLFLQELSRPRSAAATYHVGRTERAAITRLFPSFFEPRPPVPEPAARGRFFIDRVARRSDVEVVVERQFGQPRDSYLASHAVNGVPTLPGTFVTELAAQAALQLVPDLRVVGVRDLRFLNFLKLGGATERCPHRLVATLRSRDAEQAIVDVRVVSDVLAPSGVVIQRDRVHFTATAVLRSQYPSAPVWPAWPSAPETPVPDPYHLPGSSVLLTGPFVTTADTRLHPLGKRARFAPHIPDGSAFEQFVTPALLLDGLARLAVLDLIDERFIPVAAPTMIRRIDLYGPSNDLDLARGGSALELYSTPRETTFTSAAQGNRFVATHPDGRVAVQMLDARGVGLTAYDILTEQYVALPAPGGRVAELAVLPL